MSNLNTVNLSNEGISHFPVVGIGALEGGLDAFKELVHAIPKNPGMVFLLMQHLELSHAAAFAELLQRETNLPVITLSDEIQLHANYIYVIPPGKLLVINDRMLQLKKRPDKSFSSDSAIDIFFSALAEKFQGHAIGILLSATGEAGMHGLKEIKDHGGVTFVQTALPGKYAARPQVDFELLASAIPNQLLKVNEVREHTSMLQAANSLLEQSNKNLQEFASIASHDLQEPLRKIKTFTSLLNAKYADCLPEEAKNLVLKTQAAAMRMSALIRDVLNYSRVVVPENSFIPTHLEEVVKQVIRDFDLMAEEKKASIHVRPGLPVIEAIPLQMNQLFYNLIGNALKFSSEKRSPVIEIRAELLNYFPVDIAAGMEPGKTYWKLTVRDNGIGFDPQYAEQIFSIFERLHTSNAYQGTGIGLALCRKIVSNHHGIIWAESEEGRGTCFFIILPVQQ